jgi:hypothetical protein
MQQAQGYWGQGNYGWAVTFGIVSFLDAGLAVVTLGGSTALSSTLRAGGTLAGSIRNINPLGGRLNCVNCAAATDTLLGTGRASASSWRIDIAKGLFTESQSQQPNRPAKD